MEMRVEFVAGRVVVVAHAHVLGHLVSNDFPHDKQQSAALAGLLRPCLYPFLPIRGTLFLG